MGYPDCQEDAWDHNRVSLGGKDRECDGLCSHCSQSGSLVVAPAVTLATELAAWESNPKGKESKVGWLAADTGGGMGPYTVVAAVTVTITAQYEKGAFGMVIVNLAVAAITTCWLWVLVYKSEWKRWVSKQAGPSDQNDSAA